MTETSFSHMKIQSCTAKILKYPALSTVAAMVSALTSCGQQGEHPPTPSAEKQAAAQPPAQTSPQRSAGLFAPETTEQQPEEEPEMLAGDVPYIPEEEETSVETSTVIPQNAVGSVPCPPQQKNK